MHSLEQRRTRSIAIETFKIINGLSVVNQNMIEYVSHEVATRNNVKNNLATVKPRTDTMAGTFRAKAPRVWNNIPTSVRESQSLFQFKKATTHIWEKPPFNSDCERGRCKDSKTGRRSALAPKLAEI